MPTSSGPSRGGSASIGVIGVFFLTGLFIMRISKEILPMTERKQGQAESEKEVAISLPIIKMLVIVLYIL